MPGKSAPQDRMLFATGTFVAGSTVLMVPGCLILLVDMHQVINTEHMICIDKVGSKHLGFMQSASCVSVCFA